MPHRSLSQIVLVMQPQCDDDIERACAFVGVAQIGMGRAEQGRALLSHACSLGDYWACDLVERTQPR